MNDEIKSAAAGFWDWLDAWWNLPLVPRLTAGEVIVIAAGILALWLVNILINRLLGRLAPPSEGQNPHDSWLALAVWVVRKPLLFLLWTAGLGALVISQLGPWMRVWENRPLFSHPLFSLLWIVTLGSVLARALRAATRKLRAASLAAPTHWRGALALLAVLALQLLLPLLTLELILPLLPIPAHFLSGVRQCTGIFVIGALGYLVAQLLIEFERVTLARRRSDDPLDHAARHAVTQVSVLRKIGLVLIAIITVACMLMVFEPVRHFGQSILASAGLVGIIAGVAAQKSLANLFAGLQIAVTQPISLGDSITVENEFGTVEDITLTYVVVRLWDLRRMVLPISYFLEKPFINWTRRAEGLIGAVTLPVEFSAPVGELREEVDRLLAADPRWNGNTKNLEVADASGTGMQLRVVVSARTAADLAGLRSTIRESLIDFLRRNHPGSLPQNRTVLESSAPTRPTEPPAPQQ